jgi:hypothetical protein
MSPSRTKCRADAQFRGLPAALRAASATEYSNEILHFAGNTTAFDRIADR